MCVSLALAPLFYIYFKSDQMLFFRLARIIIFGISNSAFFSFSSSFRFASSKSNGCYLFKVVGQKSGKNTKERAKTLSVSIVSF